MKEAVSGTFFKGHPLSEQEVFLIGYAALMDAYERIFIPA